MSSKIEGGAGTVAMTVRAPVAPVALAPREARVAAVRAMMGAPDPSVSALAEGIRRTTRHHFALHVLPLARQTWPALLEDPFYVKLRIGACDLYASAPYTALFCAARPPGLVRAVTAAGDALPLPVAWLARLGGAAIALLGRGAYADRHRSIALVSAFIVVVDHVLDHCMSDPPAQRGARLRAVIEGRAEPDSPPLALTRALAAAMRERLDPADRAAFEQAMQRVYAWIDAEVRAMLGEPDPRGLGHRLEGVEGTIDGLLFPVARFAGEGARRWMYDVSLFVQILDDWLDYERDRESDRATPVMTGHWGHRELLDAWNKSLTGLDALVRAAGHRSPRYAALIRESYVLMMHEVTEAMIERPDA